jgi:hypothetical protein
MSVIRSRMGASTPLPRLWVSPRRGGAIDRARTFLPSFFCWSRQTLNESIRGFKKKTAGEGVPRNITIFMDKERARGRAMLDGLLWRSLLARPVRTFPPLIRPYQRCQKEWSSPPQRMEYSNQQNGGFFWCRPIQAMTLLQTGFNILPSWLVSKWKVDNRIHQ